MRFSYYIFLYVLFAWGETFSSVYIANNPRVYLLDILVFFFVFAGFVRIASRQGNFGRLKYYFLLFFLVALFSLYSLRILGNPVNDVGGQARVFLLYSSLIISSYAFLDRPTDLKLLLRVLLLAAITILGKGVFRIVTGTGYLYHRFSENPDDVNRFFSYFESSVLSFFFYVSLVKFVERGQRLRLTSLAFPLIIVVALLISNYRSVWLSVAVVTALFIIWQTRKRWSLTRRAVLVVGSMVLILYFFITQYYMSYVLMKFNSENLSGAVQGRTIMWTEALQRIATHPFMGEGVGFFRVFRGHIGTLHNDILQLIQTFGLLGVAILLFLLYFMVRRSSVERSIIFTTHVYRRVRTAFALTFLGMLVISLFEPFVLQPAPVAIIFSVLGFVMRQDQNVMTDPRPAVRATISENVPVLGKDYG